MLVGPMAVFSELLLWKLKIHRKKPRQVKEAHAPPSHSPEVTTYQTKVKYQNQ
jgi:hypothetical protein